MKKARKLVLVLIFLTIAPSSFGEESFDDYLKQETQEFNQYAEDIKKEFEQYRKIVEEEYKKYRQDILKYWPEAEISGPKKWVEYSEDKKIKKVVDFEKGTIQIDTIVDKNRKKDKKKFEKILTDLLLEDKQTAFKRDVLAQNIEKKIVKKAKHIKTDKVEKKPILAPIVTDTVKPTKSQIITVAAELLKDISIGSKPSKNVSNSMVLSVNIKLPSNYILSKAKQYKPLVVDYADKRQLDFSLVLAVMHTESAFNPMAKSHVPAYGLMQIVPGSAGKDATELLFGKQMLLAPSYLYNDKNNIEIGTAYLYLLYYKYFKNIENRESRLYCAIAGYNTGPGNVARAFTGKTSLKKAAKVINKMPPNKVYETLRKKLPYDETRKYLKKVSNRINVYKSL